MLARVFARPTLATASKSGFKSGATALSPRGTIRMNSGVAKINTLEELNKVIASEKLTFVDFYATWCGPCKAVAPVLEKFTKEYPTVQFTKVDVDESYEVAQEYGVQAMPTFVLFKKSEPIGKIVGANLNAIKKALDSYK